MTQAELRPVKVDDDMLDWNQITGVAICSAWFGGEGAGKPCNFWFESWFDKPPERVEFSVVPAGEEPNWQPLRPSAAVLGEQGELTYDALKSNLGGKLTETVRLEAGSYTVSFRFKQGGIEHPVGSLPYVIEEI